MLCVYVFSDLILLAESSLPPKLSVNASLSQLQYFVKDYLLEMRRTGKMIMSMVSAITIMCCVLGNGCLQLRMY